MEIEAIVFKILPQATGTSARGNWSSQDVVFEVPSEFNNKMCVTFRNEKISEIASLKEGDKVKVSFNIVSREWNSRWFTSLNAWRLVKEQSVVNEAPNEVAISQPPLESYIDSSSEDESSDLPF